jgi:beta-fructofuranosidase
VVSGACAATDSAELFADGIQARDPMVLFVGGAPASQPCSTQTDCTGGICLSGTCQDAYVMYYTATDTNSLAGGHHVVAYRVSTDLVDWPSTRSGPDVYTDYHWGSDYGPTESPFVVQRGQYFYLFVGPRPYDDPLIGTDGDVTQNQPDVPGNTANSLAPTYVGTDVFRSTNPLHWTNADYVGTIPAHALEVVTDEYGDYYVTSAGTAQGGVYAATLTWNPGY